MLHEIDIKPTDRVVFIHIPKTAGTTFNAILEMVMPGMRRFPEFRLENLVHSELGELRNYQFFSGHFPYALFSEIIFPEGFIGLTFLRDPIHRAISNYKFIHQLLRERGSISELPQYAEEFEMIKKITFLEFLQNQEMKTASHFINPYVNMIGTRYSRNPNEIISPMQRYGRMRSEIDSTSSKMEYKTSSHRNLNIAQERLEDIAFFGITERFQDSLFLMSYIFGWRPMLNTMHLNPTSQKDYSIDLSPELLSAIHSRVSLDLELYEFGQSIFDKHFNEMTQVLLQRYGKKEHASLKWPLPSKIMMRLLEEHFLSRRDSRYDDIVVSQNTFEYVPSDHVEGLFGWYGLEQHPIHGPMRWSGPGVQSGFDLPVPAAGKNIKVSFFVLIALRPEFLNELLLTANGIPVKIQSVEGTSEVGFLFSGIILSQAISGPFLRLVFSVPETILPYTIDPSNKDPRLLGILLNWVKLEALD